MAAKVVYQDLEDDESPLPEGEIWKPEPEIAEDPIVIERKVHALKALPKVRPSEFTRHAFMMPTQVGAGEEQRVELRKFSFDERRHMVRCYDTPAKRQLLMCARQVEKSTLLGNIMLCYSCMVPGYQTLYVSPSSQQTTRFSKDRIAEPMEVSPVLKKFTTKMLSQNILEKQFVNRANIILRYAFLSADRTRGIAAWLLAIDELQDILADNIPIIEQCLAHAPSHWRKRVYSGTPKSFDNTIEEYWSKSSTQGEWVVPCEGCNNWNILGEENIGKKGLICSKCGRLINPAHPKAQWAAMVKFNPPTIIFEGYRIPQLMVPWKPWDEILIDYEKYPRARFHNEVLGRSFDSGLRPLTQHEIRICCVPNLSMGELDHYRQLSFGQSIYAGIDWGCHDKQTRILTKTGFKYFKDLVDGEEVAQWDPETREMQFVVPKVRTVREWSKPLLHFKTKGGLDLMVTDTHRMRVLPIQPNGGQWQTESAGETAARGSNIKFVGYINWQGKEQSEFVLPGLPTSSGYSGSKDLVMVMDEWLELLGYLVTEGGLCFNKGRPSCVKMSQRTSVNAAAAKLMYAALKRSGLRFEEFPNPKTRDLNWTIYGKQLWAWYAENVGRSSSTKRLPRWVFDLNQRQLQILFDAMVLGDGTRDTRNNCSGGAFYSTSLGLCEDLQEIAIRLGLRCSVGLHKKAEGNHKTRYRVLFSIGRDYQFNTVSRKVIKVPYSGKVYCCAVPSGYIVTERNGKVSYQGNTGENAYTVLTLATYIEARFRVFYQHRFTGKEVEPDVQLGLIEQLLDYFNVKFIGADYGGGYYPNDKLTRRYGKTRVWKYQYVGMQKVKVLWSSPLGRFTVRRNEVMADIFNAIKKGTQCEFPCWEEFATPHAQDFLNIFSEYNDTRKFLQYKHAPGKPDDSFHSFLYAWLVSMLERPRPDLIAPDQEDHNGNPVPGYIGPPMF